MNFRPAKIVIFFEKQFLTKKNHIFFNFFINSFSPHRLFRTPMTQILQIITDFFVFDTLYI